MSAIEHGIHCGDLRDVPSADVRVEAARTVKHVTHVSHLADVPPRQVQVAEGIIIPPVSKHAVHVLHLAHVPVREVARREGLSLRKHLAHALHVRGFPPRDILVEVVLVAEQILHARHQRHVPVGHVCCARGAAVRAAGGTAVFSRGHGGQAVVYSRLQVGRARERRSPHGTEVRDHDESDTRQSSRSRGDHRGCRRAVARRPRTRRRR